MSQFCVHCGSALSGEGTFCGACGKAKSLTNGSSASTAAAPALEKEVELLNANGVVVTNTRFVTPEQTFSVRGITSVLASPAPPSRALGFTVIAFGAFFFLMSLSSPGLGTAIGVVVLLGGLLLLGAAKGKGFVLILRSASGEVKALHSESREFVDQVAAAINRAIIQIR
jgi:hypothetical protein